uniref:Uncharacterized protein n=1 Tax=Avena sativa TaxID=4498 RepID=A0ACD5V766_AVESA
MLPYHHINKLGQEDAWSLLKKQIVSSVADGHEIDMLKDIGLQIVEKCDGLPLAIKVMGGLLCQRDRKHHEWEIILNDSIWSLPEMSKELNRAVHLSYEDLPPCIKQCLLYYSLLPQKGQFHDENIIGMWISEGLVHGPSDDLEELGTKYYKELVAKLGEKVHLSNLALLCHNRFGLDGKIKEGDGFSEEEQQKIEKVFAEVCPPSSLDCLTIRGYFGQGLPRWIMSSSLVPLKNLRIFMIEDLACCTELPNGLCQLPYLEFIQVKYAPCIRRVGLEFMQSYHHHSSHPSQAVVMFPKLQEMKLGGMVRWEEWEWEKRVQAFPVLHSLLLQKCKLRRLPPGLAFQARSLKVLSIQHVQGLISIENFASLVELGVLADLDLERITNLPRLQKLTITNCPKLKILVGVPTLQRLMLVDPHMETLPEYMRVIKPTHLELHCSLALLASIAEGQSGPEWHRFSHVDYVKAYAREGDNRRKWYVLYTTEPNNLETNLNRPFMSGGTLSSIEDAQVLVPSSK